MNEMMQPYQEDVGVAFNLREIGQVLWAKILWIVLAVAVCVTGAFIFTKVTEKPEYRSNATLFFVCDHTNPATAVAVATYQAEDFAEMVLTQEVLQTTKENLGLDINQSQLASMITVVYNKESRIITLSVTDLYPNRAQSILDEVCRVTKTLSVDRSGAASSISVFGNANPAVRVPSKLASNMLLAFLVGLVGSVAVITAIYLMDDRIKSPDTVQRALEIGTLGAIPYQRVKDEEIMGGEG